MEGDGPGVLGNWAGQVRAGRELGRKGQSWDRSSVAFAGQQEH